MAINRGLPLFNPDGTSVVTPSRTGSRGEAYTLPLGASKQSGYADEGSFFSAYNVTDGTGIVGPVAVQADLSLKPLLHIYNGNSVTNGRSIILDFIRLRVTAIGTGGVAGSTTDFTTWVDNAGATVKTSGGTVATVVNCRSDNPGAASGAVVSFGAVVCTAAASERRLDHQRVRSVIPVVEDQYTFSFGAGGYLLPSAVATSGTSAISTFTNFSPVCILPGGNFKLAVWEASMTSTGNSWEYTVGWTER